MKFMGDFYNFCEFEGISADWQNMSHPWPSNRKGTGDKRESSVGNKPKPQDLEQELKQDALLLQYIYVICRIL